MDLWAELFQGMWKTLNKKIRAETGYLFGEPKNGLK